MLPVLEILRNLGAPLAISTLPLRDVSLHMDPPTALDEGSPTIAQSLRPTMKPFHVDSYFPLSTRLPHCPTIF